MNGNKIYHASLMVIAITMCIGGLSVPVQAETDNKTTMEDVKGQVSQAAETIKDYSADQRDAALKKAKEIMDDLDAKIKKLQTSIHRHWGKMDQAARRKAQAVLDELKIQRRRTVESYRALKRSSSGAWEQMKRGFSDSYNDLHNAWQKAEKEFAGGK